MEQNPFLIKLTPGTVNLHTGDRSDQFCLTSSVYGGRSVVILPLEVQLIDTEYIYQTCGKLVKSVNYISVNLKTIENKSFVNLNGWSPTSLASILVNTSGSRLN